MPCDSIRYITAVIENYDVETMTAAAESLEYSVSENNGTLYFYDSYNRLCGQCSDGVLQVEAGGGRLNAIKKAYSMETVKAQAKKRGWKTSMTKTGQMQLIKNTF